MVRFCSPLLVWVLTAAATASACRSAPAPAPVLDDSWGYCDGRPGGSPAQLKTPIGSAEGPRIDAPEFCGGKGHTAAYIRVHGRGTRRIVMGQRRPDGLYAPDCMPKPGDPPEICPEVDATLLGLRVLSRLERQGIEPGGIGAGVCARFTGDDYESWHVSVHIMHWKYADTAIAIVDDELRLLGVGHHFGVSVKGIECLEEL